MAEKKFRPLLAKLLWNTAHLYKLTQLGAEESNELIQST